MEMFKNFNPLEAKQPAAAPTSDPRNLATPAYKEEPKRGLETPNITQAPADNKSALDVMDEVWSNTQVEAPAQLKQVTAEQFAEAAKSFVPTFSPEQLEEAQRDPAKLQALLAQASQQGLAASANMSSQVTANYLSQEREASEARMQRNLSMTSVMNEVKSLNPSLTSGPFKSLTEDLVGKYLSKNPNAVSSEVAKMVDEYVTNKLGLQKPQAAASAEKKEKPTTNWVDFSNAIGGE